MSLLLECAVTVFARCFVVLVLRSLENQIIRSLTQQTAKRLESLRHRYLPKKEVVAEVKTEAEPEEQGNDLASRSVHWIVNLVAYRALGALHCIVHDCVLLQT